MFEEHPTTDDQYSLRPRIVDFFPTYANLCNYVEGITDDSCKDNFRVWFLTPPATIDPDLLDSTFLCKTEKDYDLRMENGCCGSVDRLLQFMDGSQAFVGYNYGH